MIKINRILFPLFIVLSVLGIDIGYSGVTSSLNPVIIKDADGDKLELDPTGSIAVTSGTTALKTHPQGEISILNSTTTPLGAGETFLGSAEDTKDEAGIIVTVYSDVSSATDGFKIEWSPDGANWIGSSDFTVAAGDYFPVSEQTTNRYFRVRYTNGDTPQSVFYIETKLASTYSKPSSYRLTDGNSLTDQEDAELVMAAIIGQKPDGSFTNFNATLKENFPVAIQEYGDTSAIDAFDNLRVSNSYTIFDSKQLYDKQPLFWDEIIHGGATSYHVQADACTRMEVTASADDWVIRQTKQRFNYQPGKSQKILFTFYGQQESGLTKQAGYFSGVSDGTFLQPDNGIYFETNGDVSWNIAKNGTVTETVKRENWNYDVLDGTGPSGVSITFNSSHIGIIDFGWLGVSRVRVGFIIDGIIRYCHYFNHANDPAFTSVYMSNPNLPLRYTIQSDGTGAGHFDHICSSVASEGGQELTGILRSVNTGTVHIDANTADTAYALIGIRLKSDYRATTVLPEFTSVMAETTTAFRWQIVLNPTIAGTFAYSGLTNSSVEYAIGTTANTVTAGTGIVIDSGYVPDSKGGSEGARRLETALRLGSTTAGVMDTFVIMATPLTANADFHAAVTFRELL